MLRASSLGCWPAQLQECAMLIRAMSSGIKFYLSPNQPILPLDGAVAVSSRNGWMKTKKERGMSDDRTAEKGAGQSSVQTIETPHVGTLTGETTLRNRATTDGLVLRRGNTLTLYNRVYPTVFMLPQPASRKLPLAPGQSSRETTRKASSGLGKRRVSREPLVKPIPCAEIQALTSVLPPSLQRRLSVKSMDGEPFRKDKTFPRKTQTVSRNAPSVSLSGKLATTKTVTPTKTPKSWAACPRRIDAKSRTQAVKSGSFTIRQQEKENPHITMEPKPQATHPRRNVAKLRTQPVEEKPHITVYPKPRAVPQRTDALSCTRPIESGSSTVEKQAEEKQYIIVDPKPRAAPSHRNVAKSRTEPVESGSSTVKKLEKEQPHITVDRKPRAPQRTDAQSCARPVESGSSILVQQEIEKPYITAEPLHHVGRTWRPLPVRPIDLRPLSSSFSKNDQVRRAWFILHETTSSDDAWNAYVTLNEYAVPVPLAVLHRVVRLVSRDRPRASTEYTRLLEILKRVRFAGGKIYLFEWNTLIDAAGRGWRKTTVRHYEMALTFFRDMTKGRTPGTTLALDSGSSDVEEEPTGEPLEPDIYTYTTLLGIAARTKDSNCLRHARTLLECSGAPPNRLTHLTLVPYFSATCQLGAVRSTLLMLEGDNMKLGLDGINALLFAYGKNRRLDIVTMIYRLLRHNLTSNLEDVEETRCLEEYRGQLKAEEFIVVPNYLVPNEITYTSLIQIMAYHGHLSTALMIFTDMISAPNTERGACLTRGADGVLRPSPYLPTAAIFRALFLGFRRHAKSLQVSTAHQLKKPDVDSPDEWTLNHLQRVFDLFMSMSPAVQVGPSVLYWLIVAFQTASGNDRELLRDVWRRVEGRFRSSSIGQNNRLHKIKVSLFPEET